MWSTLLARLSDRPSAAWLRYLGLKRVDGDTVIVAPRPGHREVVPIATPARLEPVAAELSQIRGRRTRITVDPQADPEARTEAGDDGPEPGAGTGPGAGASPHDGGAAPFDRRAAMQIPLVRQAMTFFPDAAVIDAREDKPEP